MEYLTLKNGVKMPALGLGTWQITDRNQLAETVGCAYGEGYRLIDTATAYGNEIALSKALALHQIPREELFISDKVWNTSRGFEAVQEACKTSLKKLKTDYLDLYLIHWPASMALYPDWAEINAETWRGMEQLHRDGLARAIGVCNFKVHHLEELEKTAEIRPMVDQFELHPGLSQTGLLDYCKSHGIQAMASSPLGNGQVLKNSELAKSAEELGKTPAQVCLRWALQKGAAVIPKTTDKNRLKQNMDVFGFELSASQMQAIDSLPYCGGIGIDPDEVKEFG